MSKNIFKVKISKNISKRTNMKNIWNFGYKYINSILAIMYKRTSRDIIMYYKGSKEVGNIVIDISVCIRSLR